MRHSLTLFITALVLSACLMPAQASDEKKYNELATALRQQRGVPDRALGGDPRFKHRC